MTPINPVSKHSLISNRLEILSHKIGVMKLRRNFCIFLNLHSFDFLFSFPLRKIHFYFQSIKCFISDFVIPRNLFAADFYIYLRRTLRQLRNSVVLLFDGGGHVGCC